jgi:hypothetical protein
MNYQVPAEGILKISDWEDCRVYQVVCGCTDPDHSHVVWVEAEDFEISVRIYTTNTTKFWSKNRFLQIWELLKTGSVKQEVSVVMSEQQAFNYAKTLMQAVEDVKSFKGVSVKSFKGVAK